MSKKEDLIEYIPWVLSFNPEWVAQVLVNIAKDPESAKVITEDFLDQIDYLNSKMIEFAIKCTTDELGSDEYKSSELIKKVVDEYYTEADKLDEMTGLALKTLVVFDLVDIAIETEMENEDIIKLMMDNYIYIGSLCQNYPDNMTCIAAKMHEVEDFLEDQRESDADDFEDMDFDDYDHDTDNSDNIIKFRKN